MVRIALLIVLVAFGGLARAQDVFTVPEVPVSAEAKSSAEAQRLARDKGRAAAFDILLRRLVAREDWAFLPRLAEDKPAPAADGLGDPAAMPSFSLKAPITIGTDALVGFEQEHNVFDEKSSGTTYRANITYRFKPESVRSLLRNARLPYSEEQAQRVMILPVLRTSEDVYLWEAKNPWARAWLERPMTNELTPMELPRGDLVDVEAITAEEAETLNAPALRKFLERYQVERLLIALGSLREQNEEFRLTVRLIEATPPSLEGATTSSIGQSVTETFFRGSNDDFPALARRAVAGTVERHATDWKRQTLVDFSQERTFSLTAWFDGQQEWSRILRAIEQSALVKEYDERAFNLENAIMIMTVVGAEQQFDLAMQQRGLDVWRDATGRWHIAETSRARDLQRELTPLVTDIDDEARRRGGLGRLLEGLRGDREEEEIPDLPDDLFGDGDSSQ